MTNALKPPATRQPLASSRLQWCAHSTPVLPRPLQRSIPPSRTRAGAGAQPPPTPTTSNTFNDTLFTPAWSCLICKDTNSNINGVLIVHQLDRQPHCRAKCLHLPRHLSQRLPLRKPSSLRPSVHQTVPVVLSVCASHNVLLALAFTPSLYSQPSNAPPIPLATLLLAHMADMYSNLPALRHVATP